MKTPVLFLCCTFLVLVTYYLLSKYLRGVGVGQTRLGPYRTFAVLPVCWFLVMVRLLRKLGFPFLFLGCFLRVLFSILTGVDLTLLPFS